MILRAGRWLLLGALSWFFCLVCVPVACTGSGPQRVLLQEVLGRRVSRSSAALGWAFVAGTSLAACLFVLRAEEAGPLAFLVSAWSTSCAAVILAPLARAADLRDRMPLRAALSAAARERSVSRSALIALCAALLGAMISWASIQRANVAIVATFAVLSIIAAPLLAIAVRAAPDTQTKHHSASALAAMVVLCAMLLLGTITLFRPAALTTFGEGSASLDCCSEVNVGGTDLRVRVSSGDEIVIEASDGGGAGPIAAPAPIRSVRVFAEGDGTFRAVADGKYGTHFDRNGVRLDDAASDRMRSAFRTPIACALVLLLTAMALVRF